MVGKRVLDLGSWDKTMTVRRFLTPYQPSKYVGVDIKAAPFVDVVCKAEDTLDKFGKQSFDIVVSTEVIEHTKDWKKVVSNIKNLLVTGGILVITTRSQGFPFHAFPMDYWRYEPHDLQDIFSDCQINEIASDWERPGVFIKATIPENFREKDLSSFELYSMAVRRRVRSFDSEDESLFYKLQLRRSKLRDFGYKWGHWMIEHL